MSGPDPSMEVLTTGVMTTVQDGGRPGLAHLGVPRSGAADRPSAARANELLGNPSDAAVLEVTDGGLSLRVLRRVAVVVTGAVGTVTVDGLPIRLAAPVLLQPGSTVAVQSPERGLRTYLGVRGGIDVPPVLGSRCRDVLSALGPAPLAAGDLLAVGPAPASPPQEPMPALGPVLTGGGPVVLDVLAGPRPEWFADGALTVLCHGAYRVTDDANRVGVRLAGPAVPWADDAHPHSEGVVDGAVQVPPDGRPVLFLADHPVTGGYPVVAVLTDEALAAAAQLRPGDAVGFRLAAPRGVGAHH